MPAETAVDISTTWLEKELRLPEHCARHGLPYARKVTFALKSNPRIGSRKKVLAPGYTSVDRAAEYLNQVKIVKATGWPMCAHCIRERAVGITLASVLLFLGVAAFACAFIIGALTDAAAGVFVGLFFGGLALLLLSVVPFQRVSLGRLTQAHVTDDGQAVHVTNPKPEFVREIPAAARASQAADRRAGD
ncbi:hypothetical protein [Actinoplanes sp. URMC 104]|uniref:hypothetical protein n=1 Tax=Actinoplanes sp. URMC 104 TaxID=3423409 RepID=UPI003F1CF2A8